MGSIGHLTQTLTLPVLAYVAVGLIGLGILTFSTSQLVFEDSPSRQLAARWARGLDPILRFLRLPINATQLFTIQACIVGVLLALAAAFATLTPLFLAPVVAFAPLPYLKKQRDKRVIDIEGSLDTWTLSLSNALHATPALGEAIEYVADRTPRPFRDELDVMIKERKLGMPLDEALTNMGVRVQSRVLTTVLATLIIARNTGGNLSEVLDTTVGQLREMARLEAVLRTKTAEGRAQAWLLALLPFLVAGAVHAIDNTYFAPLVEVPVGRVIFGIAIALWIGAIVAANKILDIDM